MMAHVHAIITAEDHQRVLAQAQLIQFRQNLSHTAIHARYRTEIAAQQLQAALTAPARRGVESARMRLRLIRQD